jgi:hypothetical protein
MKEKQAALRSGACFVSSEADCYKSKNSTSLLGKDARAQLGLFDRS